MASKRRIQALGGSYNLYKTTLKGSANCTTKALQERREPSITTKMMRTKKTITIAKRGRRIYLNCAYKAMEFLHVAAK